MPSEEELVAHRRGKWSMAGVPHKGWHCVDIEDLGEPQQECEMCESQTIRYVHHMEHPDYPGALEVGCVCAGHMEGSLAAARDRETSMRSRAGKRALAKATLNKRRISWTSLVDGGMWHLPPQIGRFHVDWRGFRP